LGIARWGRKQLDSRMQLCTKVHFTKFLLTPRSLRLCGNNFLLRALLSLLLALLPLRALHHLEVGGFQRFDLARLREFRGNCF
jgi:hypothetical protein